MASKDQKKEEVAKPKCKVFVEHWNGKEEGKPDINDWRVGAAGVKVFDPNKNKTMK
jgi:hypothetical protein